MRRMRRITISLVLSFLVLLSRIDTNIFAAEPSSTTVFFKVPNTNIEDLYKIAKENKTNINDKNKFHVKLHLDNAFKNSNNNDDQLYIKTYSISQKV